MKITTKTKLAIQRIWISAKPRLTAAFAFCLGAIPCVTHAGFEDNDDLRTAHSILGNAHRAAYIPSFAPLPFGLAPGAVAYASNLGLKYLPPVLEAPTRVEKFPNTPTAVAMYWLTIVPQNSCIRTI